jgi:AcrR family transcriptional regulator
VSAHAKRSVPDEIAAKLLAGADRLSVGFGDARMDDIAEASGIPRATLYYYFPGRQNVLTFLLDAMLAEYRDTVVADAEGSARGRLTSLFDRLIEHFLRHPGVAAILVSNLGELGKLSELATSTYDPLVDRIDPILRAGIEDGELREVDVARTATALSTLAHVSITRELMAGDIADGHELSTWLVDLVWDGLRPRADKTRRTSTRVSK